MSGTGKALIAATVIVIIVVGLVFAATWFDERAVAERAVNSPVRVWVWRIIWAAVAIAALGGALWVIGRGIHSVVNGLTVHAQHGLYPGVLALGRHVTQLENERYAQIVAALTNGNLDRIGAGPMKAILAPREDENLLPAPEEPTITHEDVTRFDPTKAPHFLLIGETGCGKSTAVYAIAAALKRTIPCEFVVLEIEAQNWNDQACAISAAGYLAALRKIEAERVRRANLLQAADVDHISRLSDPPPYLVVVLEEAESMYQKMKLMGRDAAQTYTNIIRDLASRGRKQGVLLIVATQTGTSDVFDVPTRKNLNHKLFFRNEPGVGDVWGIPREIGLPKLPTGTAYSLNHGALVAFPQLRRPQLPLSTLYYEQRLALPGTGPTDAGADDSASADGATIEPDGTLSQDAELEQTWAAQDRQRAAWAAQATGGAPATGRITLPWTVNEPAGLSEAQKQHIYRVYLATARTSRDRKPHLNPTVRYLYQNPDGEPLKGGQKFYLVRQVVNELRARAGLSALGEED